MKKILFSVLFLFFSVFFINAQYVQTVRGTIRDKDSKQALFGVNVVVLTCNPQKGTTSNENGEFRIDEIPCGRHEIQISYLGYKSASANVVLGSAHEIVLNMDLIQMIYQADEVIVTAEQKDKPINSMAQVSARSFTVEETERYAGTWGDPARMASNFAGVMAAGEARNDIIIRGNSPLGLLWRLEGIDVPNPNHFGAFGTTGGPISMLNNNLLRNSDFFTGAFPAQYGNALSGCFDLNMRIGNDQQREYLVQLGFNGFELGAEGPFSKNYGGSYLINYRYSFLGLLAMLGINYGPEGTVPEYQDLSFKVNLPSKKAGNFTIYGIAGNSNIETWDSKKDTTSEYSFADFGADYSYNSGMMSSGINHIYALSERTRIITRAAVSGSYSKYEFDSVAIDGSGIFPYSRNNLHEWQYSANSEIHSKINPRNKINLGIKADIYKPTFSDSTLQADGSFRIGSVADGTMTLLQAFGEWQFRLSDNLTSYLGVHGQFFELNNSSSIEPRASIKWNLPKGQALSIGYGLHSQLQPHQLYFTQSYNDITGEYFESSNQNLGFTKSNHYILAYDKQFTRNFRIKIETYYQQIFNVPVEQNPSSISLLNYGADFYIPEYDSLENNGTGRNYGIELTVEKFFSNNYYFLITTSLFEAKYTGSDGVERNSAFNNNYVVNLLGGYEFALGNNVSLTTSTKYVIAGGNRYIPYSVVQHDDGRYYREYDYDRSYEEQYNPYQRWDIMFTVRLNQRRVTNEWILNVQNITNNQNLYFNDLNPVTGEEEPTYHQGFAWMMMWRMKF